MPHIRRSSRLHRAGVVALVGAAAFALAVPATAEGTGEGAGRPVAGGREVAVVMVGFTDDRIKDPAKLEKTLRARYFGTSGSLDSYYEAVSRGRTRFVPAGSDGVTGPVDLPMSAVGCNSRKMAELTEEQLAARGITEKDYDHLSIVFPAKKADCGWSGLASVQGGTSWMPDDLSYDALVHEIGHNLGFSHHMRADCPDGALGSCRDTEETSGRTPMGDGGAASGLASPEMAHVGWFGDGERVKASTSRDWTLRPLHGASKGVRALEVPLSGGDSLFVELRRASGGLDRRGGGLFAHLVRDGRLGESVLVDNGAGGALTAGDTLTSGGTRVSVRAVGQASATVRVTLDGETAKTGGSGASAAPTGNTHSPGAGAGADAGDGTRTGRGTRAPAAEQPQGGRRGLAETGAASDATLPLAAGGAGLLAAGLGAVVLAARRRRARRG